LPHLEFLFVCLSSLDINYSTAAGKNTPTAIKHTTSNTVSLSQAARLTRPRLQSTLDGQGIATSSHTSCHSPTHIAVYAAAHKTTKVQWIDKGHTP